MHGNGLIGIIVVAKEVNSKTRFTHTTSYCAGFFGEKVCVKRVFLWVNIMKNESKPIVKKTGYVYAVIFSNNLIKVGRSYRDPEGRIRNHLANARLHGKDVEVSQKYVGGKTFFSKEIEASLINYMSGQGERINSEWFLANERFKFSELVAFTSSEILRHLHIDCVEPSANYDSCHVLASIDARLGKKEQEVHHPVDDKPERPILEEMKLVWVRLGASIAKGERVDVPINQLKALLDDAQLTGID